MSSYRPFVRKLAGIIFLGSPHSTEEDDELWARAAYAVRSRVPSRKKNTISKADVEILADLSLRFEKVAVAVPILSVYELQESKVWTSLMSNTKMLVSSF